MFGGVHSRPLAAQRSVAVWPSGACLVAVCATLLTCVPCAIAQDAPSRLVVLRAGEGATAAPQASNALVDQSLLRALVEEAGFPDARFSPTPFDDVQLLSGCDDSEGDCLQRVAIALGEDWVLVRELSSTMGGELSLTLSAQDGASAENARRAHAIVPRSDASVLDMKVRRMVRELYSAHRQSAPERTTDKGSHPPVRAKQAVLRGVGFTSLATGSALLASGLVLGLQSSRAHDDHSRIEIRTAHDVDRSQRLLDQSRNRAQAANTCFIAGSAVAAVGAGLLLWDLVRPAQTAERSLTFAAAPLRGGAALQLAGVLDGGY